MSSTNSVIFGPVFSRRFGFSLGVDLSVDLKQCNFDCLYCELDKAKPILQQKSIVSVLEVISQIEKTLLELSKKNQKIDVLTITANGEPTLYPYLDELILNINKLKDKFSFKTLILSNAGKINEEKIQNTLLKFDKVKLSLDTLDDKLFKKLDRPDKNIKLENIKLGILEFAKKTDKEFFLETLFVHNLNDTKEEILELNNFYQEINKIAKNLTIHIGTVDRPSAYAVHAVPHEKMLQIFMSFDPNLPIILTSRAKNSTDFVKKDFSKDEILNTLAKRPMTKNDIILLLSDDSLVKLKELEQEEKIRISKNNNLEFYTINKDKK
jgi:wyosine [tRNA(Phe)-imidazoG37] synthetase (radical SAM superfamily)